MVPERVCIDESEVPDWTTWPSPSPQVCKIVVGRLDADAPIAGTLPEDLAQRFPGLTHLYVWGLGDLESVPALPAGLECLDVRKCPKLARIDSLPVTLQELVLEGSQALAELPLQDTYGVLWTLSLAECPGIEERTVHRALRSMPRLVELDLSGCSELSEVRQWPQTLERIDLNRCEKLETMPASWPPRLRRLGLRAARRLRVLPPLAEPLDYIDLAGMEELTALDEASMLHLAKLEPARRPRTLFLYRSGLRVPPATEHGEREDENVAERSLSYYRDVDLCGRGEVKRCKVLLLGNGSAGKTCLSLALVPGQNPERAKQLGTTHGVQFFRYELPEVRVGQVWSPVELQLWDFGGQEIYHQTHRLFMSKGAVFVLLWDPGQDGKEAPSDGHYQDEWRPLSYWIDLIHQACPWNPRIAIVCSHHTAPTDALEQHWKEQAGAHREHCQCFYVDSLEGQGQLPELENWITRVVGEVVETQGAVVPAYWEIAQDLVSSWFPRADPGETRASTPERESLTFDEFQRELAGAIEAACPVEGSVSSQREGDARMRYPQLAFALHAGRFELTDDRVRRALEFLTHSGWVYFHPKLFEERVIIGQKWALDGIYSVLERRQGKPVYDALLQSKGQFTRRDLGHWVWDAEGYREDQQRLLLSFMRRIGVCFELVSEAESRWREPVYKTFEHLPSSEELGLMKGFERLRRSMRREHGAEAVAQRDLECPQLHRGHWHRMLGRLGELYGTDALYAADGFELVTAEDQHALLQVDLAKGGFGGYFDVYVAGPDAGELAERIETFVRGFLPRPAEVDPQPRDAEAQPPGGKPNRIRLFVSYTWNPESAEQEGWFDLPIPKDYEAPVDAIEQELSSETHRVDFQRDKRRIGAGDSIREFMQNIKQAEKVLVVHSDKYWRSPFCIYELSEVLGSFGLERTGSWSDVLLFLELPSSGIRSTSRVDEYVKFWRGARDMPTMLRGVVASSAELQSRAMNILTVRMQDIVDRGISEQWTPERREHIVEWIRSNLGLKMGSVDGADPLNGARGGAGE